MADDTTLSELRSMFTAARRTASSDTAPSGSSLDSAVAHEMRLNRQAGQSKTAGSNISLSAPRPADPRFYWQNSRLPYDFSKGDHVRDMREICRMVTSTHPTVGSVIDTYATYPLAGMEMVCPKSPEIADFYQQLFIDQLHYDEFLIDAGKEYWKVGEAFPYATFNELLGTWESDELMLPEDTKVVKSPFLMEPRLEMKLPAYIRKIIIERKPQQEYVKLITAYPELVAYARAGESMLSINDEDDDPRVWIPVSNMVMSHIKLSTDHFNPRGVSIIMRALRSLVQEEKLNSAQEAIADRLYTPFILARIGASATDLGTKAPWIPTTGDLDAFLDDMNAALAGDFRLAVHHFAVQIDNVFGRETIPDLTSDFERLEGKTPLTLQGPDDDDGNPTPVAVIQTVERMSLDDWRKAYSNENTSGVHSPDKPKPSPAPRRRSSSEEPREEGKATSSSGTTSRTTKNGAKHGKGSSSGGRTRSSTKS